MLFLIINAEEKKKLLKIFYYSMAHIFVIYLVKIVNMFSTIYHIKREVTQNFQNLRFIKRTKLLIK